MRNHCDPNRTNKLGRSVTWLILFALLVTLGGPFASGSDNRAAADQLSDSPDQASADDAEQPPLYAGFKPNPGINSVLIYELDRDLTLLDHNSASVLPIPASATLMLALLVAENLDLQQPVTISANAAYYNVADTNEQSYVLQQDENYSVETLLYAMLFENSFAASVALAEKISGSVGQCVDRMNQRARELGMKQTVYRNVTGTIVLKEGGVWSNAFNLDRDYDLLEQKSTLKDTAVLIRALLKIADTAKLFSERERFLRLPNGSMITIRNPLGTILTADKKISASWNHNQQSMSFSFLSGQANQIRYLVLMTDRSSTSFARQAVDLVDQTLNYYEVTPLVRQGQSYPGYDRTRQGDQFGLVFLNTLQYLHPRNDSFVRPAVQYISLGPFARPLQRGTIVGHVVFTLNDGREVRTDVGPDRAIFSDNNLITTALDAMQNNPNLALMILALMVILCVILILKLISLSQKLVQQIKLYRLNEQQQKLKNQPRK